MAFTGIGGILGGIFIGSLRQVDRQGRLAVDRALFPGHDAGRFLVRHQALGRLPVTGDIRLF